MEYNLEIEDNIDVTLDPNRSWTLSFVPRTKTSLPLGCQSECLPIMTLRHVQKIITSNIKVFHKQCVDFTKINVYYLGHKLGEGKVLKSMANIESLPN